MNLEIQTPRWALPLLKSSRYKAVYGGRGSGKSHFFAELAIEHSIMNPHWSLVAIREVQKSIAMSVKRLLEQKIEKLKVENYFIIQRDAIYRKGGSGVFVFIGMNDHTSDSIKSLENFDCAWVEEAQNFSEKSLELLRPTIRKRGSEIWFCWNPRLPTDPVDKLFRSKEKPPTSIVISCSYKDNPFFPDVLKKEIDFDKVHDQENFAHVWLGAYRTVNVNRVLMQYSHLEKAKGAAKLLNYKSKNFAYMGLDVADGGDDKPAVCVRSGSSVLYTKELGDKNGFEIATTILPLAQQYKIARCYYDATGVGASIKSELYRVDKKKRLGFKPEPFLFGGKILGADTQFTSGITNAQFFSRLNAQGYWNLKLRLDNTMRALAGHKVNLDYCLFLDEKADDKLLLELSQIEFERDTSDKIRIIKAPGSSSSPNLADAVMMSFTRDLVNGLRSNTYF